jgi:hypothetical protein
MVSTIQVCSQIFAMLIHGCLPLRYVATVAARTTEITASNSSSVLHVDSLPIKNLLPSDVCCSSVCFAAVPYKRMSFQSRSLATAISLAPQFFHEPNIPQYKIVLHRPY